MDWYDKRPVYLISTLHPPESVGAPTTVLQRSQAGPREPVPCPPAQCAYQENIVDRLAFKCYVLH